MNKIVKMFVDNEGDMWLNYKRRYYCFGDCTVKEILHHAYKIMSFKNEYRQKKRPRKLTLWAVIGAPD